MSQDENPDDLAFERAYERAAYGALERQIGAAFTRHGLGFVDRSLERREQVRVSAIIERDQADRRREQYRRDALAQVANGSFENLADTVVEPTPEWMEKGPVRSFTPRLRDDQVQSVKTLRSVRRVLQPQVVRLVQRNLLTPDQAGACIWYREQFIAGGLEGHYTSGRYGAEAGLRGLGSAGALAAGGLPATEQQLVARHAFREARAALPPSALRFFEAIVLNDVPPRRAARFTRCRNERILAIFGALAQALLAHCEAKDIAFKAHEGLGG